jgi:hypothetical protein
MSYPKHCLQIDHNMKLNEWSFLFKTPNSKSHAVVWWATLCCFWERPCTRKTGSAWAVEPRSDTHKEG